MSLLDPQDWSFPVPIAYGPGRLKEIGALCRRAGMSNPLIVTDRSSSELSFVGETAALLASAGLGNAVFAEISPNPRDDEIQAGRQAYRDGGHDGIIGIGGGSGMDGAKAICLTATNDIDLWDFEYESPAPDMSAQPAFPPLICIPTTAGTGAETASTAMITDTQRMMKFCIWHEDLLPACALLDPALTVSLPRNLTAWTGIDALVHAIEAYCVPGFNPLCDGLALESIRLINKWLRAAFREPDSLEARGGMLAGSCLAGIAFMKGLGHVHAISHMIGAEYDTQHGLTNAIILPAVLEFNEPAIQDKIAPMAQAMDLPDATFECLYQFICATLDELSIPKTLRDIGVEADCAHRIAKKAVQDSAAVTNPRPASISEMQEIIEVALTSGRD
jgi:alcohol dehydrogenase class IV